MFFFLEKLRGRNFNPQEKIHIHLQRSNPSVTVCQWGGSESGELPGLPHQKCFNQATPNLLSYSFPTIPSPIFFWTHYINFSYQPTSSTQLLTNNPLPYTLYLPSPPPDNWYTLDYCWLTYSRIRNRLWIPTSWFRIRPFRHSILN